MPWIPEAFIDELLSRTSLEELVAEYVPLKRSGKQFMGSCPFHNDKNPSFSVSPDAQLYHCYSCGAAGNAYQFVQHMEGLEFPEAVRFLAERAHMEVPEEGGRRRVEPQLNSQERERIYEANVTAARYFRDMLKQPEGAKMLSYLYKRGLNDRDIAIFGLGAAPLDGWQLIRHLQERGFDEALLKKAGLLAEQDNGRRYPMFRNRVMFPIITTQGKVIGFGGRIMGDEKPKYLNTSETDVFSKGKNLYNLNMARKERDAGRIVLVEGYMDAVSLHKYGVRGIVATLGTAITEEQARLIKRQAPEVWISYDGDAAGHKAALKALDIFDALDGITPKVIDYPAGQDPDEFVRENGLQGFEGLPRYGAAEYRMLRARDGLDLSTQDGLTQYAMRCCEILRKVKDPIVLENHLRKLSQQTGYERDVLLQQIRTIAAAPEPVRRREFAPRRSRTAQSVAPEEQALLTLISQGRIPLEMVKPEDFPGKLFGRLRGGCWKGTRWRRF